MPNNLTDAEETRLLDLSLVTGDLLALVTTLSTDAATGTELTGGSYARQSITWAAAASGSKATSAAIAFVGLPASESFGWEVLNSAGSARKWYGLWSSKTGSAAASTDIITAIAHGYADGQGVVFQTGYTPAGLTAGTRYYARDILTDSFKVAATLGGVALDVTADTASIVVGKVLLVPDGAGLNIASGSLVCTLT